jgi:cytochrome b561
MTSASPAPSRYDGLTIAIHWISAVIVITLWLIGQLVDFVPRGPVRTGIWSTHVTLGFLLAVLLITRIVWRLTSGRQLPPAETGVLGLAAKLGHLALYALLIAVVALGLADAFLRGFNMFDLFHLPQIGDRAWVRQVNGLHELAANAVMAMALLHAVAALFHRYVLKDQVLARMGLGAN